MSLNQKDLSEAGKTAAIINNFPHGIVITDVQGRIRNDVRVEQAPDGTEVFDAEGRRLESYDWPLARTLRGQCLRSAHYEIRVPGRPARFACYDTEIVASASGDALAVIAVHDVTRQRTAETQYRSVSTTLETLIDASPAGMLATDSGGRIRLWNSAAERILGYAADEMLGNLPPLPLMGASEEGPREVSALHSDGSAVTLLVSSAQIGPQDGFGRYEKLAIFSDITERVKMRQQLDRAQRLESLGALAGGVAHDFNNLLTGIIGNASLGMYTLDSPEQIRPLLEDILSAGERAAALTRQLLAYAGKGKFVADRLDLAAMTREIASRAWNSIAPSRIRLHLDGGAEQTYVHADRVQIQQVIFDLLANAVEAIPEKESGVVSVRATIETVSASVQCISETGETIPPGAYAVLEVRDTGTGIDEPTRARIFEPFFSTKFTGRGMGLAAVLGIVRQHSGAMCLETEPGRGTTFRIYLPLAQEGARAGASGARGHELEGNGLILVVDDEDSVRSMARRALEHRRYRVVLAEHGQAALEIFPSLQKEVQAVFLDLTMPVMGGEETLRHLQKLRPDLPVILMSGFDADALGRFEVSAAAAFLQKPFTADQLVIKLRELFGSLAQAR